MNNGFSLYPRISGQEESLTLLRRAHAAGLTRVILSMRGGRRVPEKKELTQLLKVARDFGMEVIACHDPELLSLLCGRGSLSALKMLGIATLRLNPDLSADTVARLARTGHGLRLQLDASSVTGNFLSALLARQVDLASFDALHSCYPRQGTGLSEEALVRKNIMLHKLGIPVGAFVPTEKSYGTHAFYDGMTTLEDHRGESMELAARHLVALGTDSVFLAGPHPSERELQSVARLRPSEVVISARLLSEGKFARDLLTHTFTARADGARDAIRAKAEPSTGAHRVAPEAPRPRPAGAVTLDNEHYGVFMGELQIVTEPQGPDPRVNVCAQIDEEELGLLQYITPGRRFSFRLHA